MRRRGAGIETGTGTGREKHQGKPGQQEQKEGSRGGDLGGFRWRKHTIE